MPLRCAIIGLDPVQRDWITALKALTASAAIVPVAAGHRTVAAARDLGDLFDVPAFDDLRQLLLQHNPQILVLDRPSNADTEFLAACAQQNIGIFSLGPPVHSVAEAHDLVWRVRRGTNIAPMPTNSSNRFVWSWRVFLR
jgi:predicted dehydrogenase